MKTTGFTLVELLVVLALLGLLGSLVLPNVLGRLESAKSRAAASAVQRLSMAVESYYLDTGELPNSLGELTTPSGAVNWNGPYVQKSLLTDPWGHPYLYRQPGEHGRFDLYTYGSDNAPGGSGDARDITNRD